MTVYFNTVHYIMYIYIYICSAHSDPYLYCWPNFRINGEASWQRLKKRTMHLTNYSVSRPGMSCWIGQKVVVLRNLSFVLNLGSTFGSLEVSGHETLGVGPIFGCLGPGLFWSFKVPQRDWSWSARYHIYVQTSLEGATQKVGYVHCDGNWSCIWLSLLQHSHNQ